MSMNDNPKILYVDDEEKALKYFRMAFANTYEVLTALSVAEAIEILEKEHENIGVLITDQRMPLQTGVELLDHVRAHYPTIIRLLTTAYADLEDAIAAVNRGEIFRYVTKPWDIPSLETELGHAMEFFQLRRERDALMAEKLSVHRRQAQLNRARDLLITSSALPALRHANPATRHYLNAFLRALDTSGPDTQHWVSEEQDIARSISIAQGLALLADENTNQAPETIDLPSLITQYPQLSGSVTEAGSVNGHLGMFNSLIISIITALGGDQARIAVTMTLHDRQKATLDFNTEKAANMTNDTLDAWLHIYLVAFHHGGYVQVRRNKEQTQCTVHLPLAGSAELECDTPSLDEIFSQLEELS